MHKAIIIIKFFVIILLTYSCAAKVSFVYKKTIPELKDNLSKNPLICIAIISKDITDIRESLKKDIDRFSGQTVYLKEITNETKMSKDRNTISNISEIQLKYPEVQYVIIFYQDKPEIAHSFQTRNETEQYTDKDGVLKTRETGYDIFVYETIFSAVCDTILFDLRNNRLMAKATDQFSEVDSNEYTELFPDHTLFGLLSDMFVNPKNNKGRYPSINSISAFSMHKYFYSFLEYVSSKKVKK
jgi:hypothetical protein